MAINRTEEVKMLTAAGFRVLRKNAKTTTYERNGVQVLLGAGTGTGQEVTEVRAAIRKADREDAKQHNHRMALSMKAQIDEAEASGRKICCGVCKGMTGYSIEVGDREGLYRHVQATHQVDFDKMVTERIWESLGVDSDTGKVLAPPVKKNREFWQMRTERMISQEGLSHYRDVIDKLNSEGFVTGSGKKMNDERWWLWFDEVNRNREARADRPLLVQGDRPGVVVPQAPKSVPVPAPVMATLVANEEPKEAFSRKKMPQHLRIPLWRRIAIMHDQEGMEFSDIAQKLNDEKVKKPSGAPWLQQDARAAYNAFHEQREMFKVPKASRVEPRPQAANVPPYVIGILSDDSLPADRKVSVLRALVPTLPPSVGLMMDDPEITHDQRLRILSILFEAK